VPRGCVDEELALGRADGLPVERELDHHVDPSSRLRSSW
jgi:hypothetical protein